MEASETLGDCRCGDVPHMSYRTNLGSSLQASTMGRSYLLSLSSLTKGLTHIDFVLVLGQDSCSSWMSNSKSSFVVGPPQRDILKLSTRPFIQPVGRSYGFQM